MSYRNNPEELRPSVQALALGVWAADAARWVDQH